MCRMVLCFWVSWLVISPAWGQPREWSDDFQTATTWNSASQLGPCYGGPVPKYTVIEALISDIFNERVLSGGGKFIGWNRDGAVTLPPLAGRGEVAVVGWFGTWGR